MNCNLLRTTGVAAGFVVLVCSSSSLANPPVLRTCPAWVADTSAQPVAPDSESVAVGPTSALLSASPLTGIGPTVAEYWLTGSAPNCRDIRPTVVAGKRRMIVDLTRIRPASRYHVRLAARSGTGTVFGPARAFVTLPLGRVPEGVTAGRTYLGRMRRAAALSLLRQSAAAPLTFSFAGARWRVSPSTVGVRTNAVRRVDEALRAAPDQMLPALRLSLDGSKLRAYVAGLSRRWAHKAMQANVRLAGTRAVITAAAPAVKVNTERMISLVRASVLSGRHRVLPLAVVREGAPATGIPKAVVVRLGDQTLTAYLDGKPVLTTPVTTGRPALPTPIGSYSIKYRASPYVFTSPWAPGSPYWYPPTPVTWAMYFYDNDFLHDDPGEPSSAYGAGSQYGPYASHGCVHIPHSAMAFLFRWLPVGAPVIVAQT